jgi:hypothetical protein
VCDQVSYPYQTQAILQLCTSQSLYFWIENWKTNFF